MMEDSTNEHSENMNSPSNYNIKERNFLELDLKDQSTLSTDAQPVFVVQSPKTPTLSRKLKAVSLDSEPQPQSNTLEVSRDVFSMPNTPKRQIKHKLSCDFDDGIPKGTLAPSFTSNLKKFPSNNSISGSQTLKTLPEINALQDFSDCPVPEPQKVRSKGLLERRGSNASLTIDLGSTQSIPDIKPVPLNRLNTAKSVSNLYLSSMNSVEKCAHAKKGEVKVNTDRRKYQETCGNCTIYESVPKMNPCSSRCQNLKRCSYCSKSRRKSLSNENLYVPHCRFCESENKESESKYCKGINQRAIYPRQPDLDSQFLSDDFKLHIKNIQYLETARNVLSIPELKGACERTSKLHQEFWEVPINLPEKCYVSGSQSKNRYNGIIPNEHSRVILSSNNGYIHANFIKGPDYVETAYIATQGPLSNTCTDFWEMIWYSQCKCIVMLTNLVEKGKNKCELYFPLGKKTDTSETTFLYIKTTKQFDKFTFDQKITTEYDTEIFEFEEKNEITLGKYHIKYINQRELDECQIRLLELKKTDANVEPRVIHHYWYNKWPDHNKANPEQVLKIAIDVLNVTDGKNKGNEEVNDLNVSASEHSECEDISTNILSSNENGSRFTFNETIEASNSSTALELSNQIEICQDVNNIPISTNSSMDVVESSQGEVSCAETRYTVKSNDSSTMYFEKVNVKTETYSSTKQNNFSFSVNLQNNSNKVTPEIDHRISFDDTCGIRYQSTSYHDRSESQTDVLSEPGTSNPKSREGSISDFNKETLSNRCSLDSKLGHLNQMSGFKSQLKREMYPLKTKYGINDRKKSTEHVKLPIVVHCSAGIGRTGCFLAILNGIQQLRRNSNVDILAILCSLRLNRGGMVQTAEQYELIHRVLSLYSETM